MVVRQVYALRAELPSPVGSRVLKTCAVEMTRVQSCEGQALSRKQYVDKLARQAWT